MSTPIANLIDNTEEEFSQEKKAYINQTTNHVPNAETYIQQMPKQMEQVNIPTFNIQPQTDGFKVPFMENIDKKSIKIGMILVIIITLTQNKQFQSAIVNNLPPVLRSTEMMSNISVALISVLVAYFIYKFMN